MAPPNGSNLRQRKPHIAHYNALASNSSSPSQQQKQATARAAPFQVHPLVAFYVLLAAHTIAALYSPIQDCDEVFNYWEPTHYLTHGHAFQTWEYSPDYAIRSWAYTGLHALLTLWSKTVPYLNGSNAKLVQFYLLRVTLGFICALCETRLFTNISAVLNPRIALTFLGIMATAPGMFHASIAYLPSSFAIYFVMLGMAAFMDWRGGLRTAQGIWCIGTGACLGWPFAVAMSAPFLLEELCLAMVGNDWRIGLQELFWRVVDGSVRTLLVLTMQVAVDCFFYKQLPLVVPFNIVRYNVFSQKGPDLYGTEPWHFYVRNLALNFHLWLPLALLSFPLLLLQHFTGMKGATRSSYLRLLIFLTPFYLWLAIFTLQPHKEERFMYPAYPALALNAAVSLHILLANFGSIDYTKNLLSKLRLAAVLSFALASVFISAFRVLGTMTAYAAPLSIYTPLHDPAIAHAGDTVCLGKEWYRFPSHYLLPADMHAKFIRSEFHGLLPGEFSEAKLGSGFGLFPGTWLVPPGMNDENREDVGKYTDVKHCTFLVDSHLPSTETTSFEPAYVKDGEHWERVKCLPFLDAALTGTLGRLGWVPDLPFVPQRFKRTWGEYCLLKRKKKLEKQEPRRMDLPRIETLQ